MMRKLLPAALAAALLVGCATVMPPQSQLQIREFQTRQFDHTEVRLAMKAMMNVLQDEGFIIKQGNLDLGLLSAEKQVDVEKRGEAFWATFWGQQRPLQEKLHHRMLGERQ